MRFAFMSRILTYEGFGVQTFLEGLLRGITQVTHDHEIFLFMGPDQPVPDWVRVSQYRIVHLPPNPERPLGLLIWDHLAVGRACRRLGIEALYAPAHIRPLFSPCPVVVTVHDMMYHLFPQDWSLSDRIYFGVAVSLLTQHAAMITVDSWSTKSDVIRLLHIPDKKVKVIYPGIPSGFAPLDAEIIQPLRIKYNLEKPFILYVGSQHPRKNLVALVEAFEHIASDISHDLVIVGPPIWHDLKLEKKIKTSSFTNRMRWIGFVPREELPLFFNAADVFVFPSRYEGFGLPVLEAMACGCPTVTTNASSLPEVAGDAAILVLPDDIPALGDAILRVLTDNELHERMRQKGLQQAGKFSWVRAARDTIDLLEKAAGIS
jgi:glycosyltransferase involved in cell wall biosynthesis